MAIYFEKIIHHTKQFNLNSVPIVCLRKHVIYFSNNFIFVFYKMNENIKFHYTFTFVL